ncbi:hypothetical protein MXB_418 [Myxobolus squamalis]|nr:hypothetical protein MXB_418 [Myxobolus squamalis]
MTYILKAAIIGTKLVGVVKKIRVFYDLSLEYSDVVVVVAGLGDSSATYCENEEIDLKLEIIRCGIYSVGEVAALSDYEVRKWISGFDPKTKMLSLISKDSSTLAQFQEGFIQGKAQTFAAFLAETPSN